ncbi:MAG: beta-ketoacyl-ACP synthase [Candidatus Spyradosoma sp.]
MNFTLSDPGFVCALGVEPNEILTRALAGDTSGMIRVPDAVSGRNFLFGRVPGELPGTEDSDDDFRCNRLLLAALAQMRTELERLRAALPPERVGIVLGASNTGVDEAQTCVHAWLETGERPAAFRFEMLELGTPALFLRKVTGFRGPAFVISTACSSGAKAFAAARRLLLEDVCDAVIVGGADGFCRFAINGFHALQSLSENAPNPMSRNRDGIALGEGAALFVMEKKERAEPGEIALLGVGETSDAHHLTAPHPEGAGAKAAMLAALADAGLAPEQIDFINLHGTGTPQNDAAESRAVHEVFGGNVPCASTKPLTGHALGASGAIEAALSWLMLRRGRGLIPHVFDGERDDALPRIRLATRADADVPLRRVLSSSFAFGGSNAAVILGKL